MTMEEFDIISKCNGVFTETFRPDLNEEETEKEILNYMEFRFKNYEEKVLPVINAFDMNLMEGDLLFNFNAYKNCDDYYKLWQEKNKIKVETKNIIGTSNVINYNYYNINKVITHNQS